MMSYTKVNRMKKTKTNQRLRMTRDEEYVRRDEDVDEETKMMKRNDE